MGIMHTVTETETLRRIAHSSGVAAASIWDDTKNSRLRESRLRGQLCAGDRPGAPAKNSWRFSGRGHQRTSTGAQKAAPECWWHHTCTQSKVSSQTQTTSHCKTGTAAQAQWPMGPPLVR